VRLLLVDHEHPELAAFNLTTGAVDGRLLFADAGGAGITSAANSDPWLLDQVSGLVIRLDAQEPWKATGTWNVGGPLAVIQVSCTKAYVVRESSLAIIDPSRPGSEPSGFVATTDFRDLIGAVWVPEKRRVFVLAGNADGPRPGCSTVAPSIFAIDGTTDTIVSLAGKGANGSIQLGGNAPTQLLYDAPFDRLLVLSAGCTADGGVRQRRIEQVDLATGAVKSLLSLDARSGAASLTLLDGEHALVTLAGHTFAWDPHDPQLGPELPSGVDLTALDGRGGFVGVAASDGGLDIVGIPRDPDAGVSVIGRDPFSSLTTRAASVEPWPHR
jgi:hypothetical protein